MLGAWRNRTVSTSVLFARSPSCRARGAIEPRRATRIRSATERSQKKADTADPRRTKPNRLMLHIAAAAVFLFAQAASATAIIGIQTRDALIIAGDSRGSNMGGGQLRGISDDVCKVHVVAKAVFAMAGMAEDVKGAFSSQTAIINILRRRVSLQGAAEAVVNELRPRMLTFLQRLKADDLASFATETAKESIADMLIGEVDKDGSVMLRVILRPVTLGGLSITHEIRRRCATPCQGRLIFPLGVVSGKDLDANPYAPSQPLHLYARSLELKILDPRAGGPIDVVQLDRNGHKWITRKENCRDEE